MYTGTDGIKASATTARALAAASPFLANGVLYRGEKIDKIMKVDLKTGNVLNDFGNTNNENHPPTLTGNESILLLGRTDFHIRAYDATSGLEQVRLPNAVDDSTAIYFYFITDASVRVIICLLFFIE